ncbi:MAG: dTDP-4-dehydrorhamnose 3,5-epimerase [Synergistaceae bacterium]
MIQKFNFNETIIQGVFEIQPFIATDERGSFVKDYAKEVFESNGITHELKEVFYTVSKKGVIRALHFQRVMQQPKLVRCVCGHVYDVVVDLRMKSSTYKKWTSFDLSSDTNIEVLIPNGCAHGYLVLEDSVVSYKCAEKFYPEYDDGIIWNDKDINIDWPLHLIGGEQNLIISKKDTALLSLEDSLGKRIEEC